MYCVGRTSRPVPDSALVLLVLGDFGVDPSDSKFASEYASSERVLNALNAEAGRYLANDIPTKLLLTGDLVYPSGTIENASRLDHLFSTRLGERLGELAKLDKFAVPGNHDCEGSLSFWAEFQQSQPQHRWKSVGGRKANELFGERQFPTPWGGKVRCQGENMGKYALHDEFASLRERQLKWLEDEVAPKRAGDWLIVMGHFPLYSFRGNGPTSELQGLLLKWMQSRKVDAYLSGHDHALQRIVSTDSLQFLVSGAGGYPLHLTLKADADSTANTKASLMQIQDEPGFMTLEFTSPTSLGIYFINQHHQVTSKSTIP
ncbi:hypothetical protein BASA82_000143 [Batrachochytrium salamandrivorans]|nr:hypothetical protein BASA82_000143 [Batrachochytrium salamandrivorans]